MSVSRAYLVATATLGAAVLIPSLLGWEASVVQSESMEPNVSVGDVVLADQLPESSPIPIGGVITFRVDERDIVHRVITVNEDNTLVTAGDANHEYDPWSITRADITGQARILVPYVGLPGMWAQRGEFVPLAVWLTATAAALLLAVPPRQARARTRVPGSPRDVRDDAGSPVAGAAAALVGLVVLVATVPSLPPVDASFTGVNRATALWEAKAYPAITVGALADYGALAASAVRDADAHRPYHSTVNGAVGTTPGTVVSGFRNKDVSSTNIDNGSARNAMAAARSLHRALHERPLTRRIPAGLAGTLPGGVYESATGAFSLSGSLTLDAKGDPSARFVFRTTSTLTMAQRSRIVLAGGAQAANVYWLVGTDARIGDVTSATPDTTAIGTILAENDIALRSVELTGRAVSLGGTVFVNGHIDPHL